MGQLTGGHVAIHSEPGNGTTVELYVPRRVGGADQAVRGLAPPAGPSTPQALAGEAILVAEGLLWLAERPGITLLFTDLVMPGLSGLELADQAVHHQRTRARDAFGPRCERPGAAGTRPGQAAIVASARRRRMARPTRPKPPISIAQVPGSGTPDTGKPLARMLAIWPAESASS